MLQSCRILRSLFRCDVNTILRKSNNIEILQCHNRSVLVRTFYTNRAISKTLFSKLSVLSRPTSSSLLLHRSSTTNSSIGNDKANIQVYYGNLTSQIRAVKLFSLITSATGIAAQPMLIQKATEMSNLGVGIAVGSFIGFFTFITPFLLHWITKKYVTYLHYNPETQKYTATTLSLFLRQKKTEFAKEDVTVPEVSGMFTSFTVNKGIALFVDPRLFSHPEHYGFIMGYDKPLDFKLDPHEIESKKKI